MKKTLSTIFALLLIVTVAPTAFADDNKAGCDGKATKVADEKLVTVSGELVHCKETMGKVAEKNGMCPTGTPASGKAVLLKTEEGEMILVTAAEKLNLGETIVKVRAHGTLSGSHLTADKLEGFCSKSKAWHEIKLTKAEEL